MQNDMRFHKLDCSLEIGRSSYDKSWNALAFASSLRDLSYSYFPRTYNLSAAKHDTSFMHHSTLHQQLLSSCNSPRRFAAAPNPVQATSRYPQPPTSRSVWPKRGSYL